MIKSHLILSAAEYRLRKNLEAFLKSTDEAKKLPDHQRSSPAPKHALTAEPLAPNLGEFHRSRVLAELRSCLKIVQECSDAILKPNDNNYKRHYANLLIALERMRWMLHRAQDENVWRDRQIPQERHNSDPWPLEPSPSSSSTSRLDALEREFEHIAFDALRRGIPPDEVQSLPECIAARTRFEVEQKSLVKHERQSIDRGIITKGEYKTLRHAREGVPERVESWANAEAEVRRFLEQLTPNRSSEAASQRRIDDKTVSKLPELGPHDRQAWQLYFLDGMTQSKVVEKFAEQYGKLYTQGQISRMISRAKRHADANGLTELIPTKEAGNSIRTVSVDPAKLDMGKRTDPRDPRPSDISQSSCDD